MNIVGLVRTASVERARISITVLSHCAHIESIGRGRDGDEMYCIVFVESQVLVSLNAVWSSFNLSNAIASCTSQLRQFNFTRL